MDHNEQGLPQVSATTFTERTGVIEVARIVNDARCIWREILMHDVGIDGHIEHVDQGGCVTGRLVLVQVKSGVSYFQTLSNVGTYSPSQKHRNYWEVAPLPVILILHNPETGLTIWADARRQLRARRSGHIQVPHDAVFNAQAIGYIFSQSTHGVPSTSLYEDELLRSLIENRHPNPQFPLDFLDLFVMGIADAGLSIHFSMDLVMELVENRLYESDFGYNLGPFEFQFLDRYVAFLVAQRLAFVDYDSFLTMKESYGLVGQFVSPLTSRGRSLLWSIANWKQRLGQDGTWPVEHIIRYELGFEGFDYHSLDQFKSKVLSSVTQGEAC